jgi:adenylosuccinate lyase
MIPRYSNPEMARLWTSEYRYECWLEVELAAARAMHETGIILLRLEKQQLQANFDAGRIDEWKPSPVMM